MVHFKEELPSRKNPSVPGRGFENHVDIGSLRSHFTDLEYLPSQLSLEGEHHMLEFQGVTHITLLQLPYQSASQFAYTQQNFDHGLYQYPKEDVAPGTSYNAGMSTFSSCMGTELKVQTILICIDRTNNHNPQSPPLNTPQSPPCNTGPSISLTTLQLLPT